MTICPRHVYDWSCDESRCSSKRTFNTRTEADRHDLEHVALHARGKAVAGQLDGLILREVGPGTHVDKAAEQAERQGLPFFVFNGRVLLTSAPNLDAPFCLASDVPGLPT